MVLRAKDSDTGDLPRARVAWGWGGAAEKRGKSNLGMWRTAVHPPRMSIVLEPRTLPLLPPAPSSQGLAPLGSP